MTVPAFTAQRDLQFASAAAVIRDVYATEHRWFLQGDPASVYLPWMPFQPGEFMSIMFECAPEMKGRYFLDVGCGPGTKMRLARHFFGLDTDGIEIDRGMAEAAVAHGVVFPSDALEAAPGFYGAYDLVWMYRPFRDVKLERALEDRVAAEMKPGAILAGGAWETCPADRGWVPVFDDWELRRGAWQKPDGA